MSRRIRLLVEVDAELFDPEWDEETLLDNTPDYFESMVERAERHNRERFPENQSYRIIASDLTVWTPERYLADLADVAAADDEVQAALRAWNALEPEARRALSWFLWRQRADA